MTTHLYTICWNEAKMLPFLFRHYDPWVDRYIVYDDGSTDGSIEILKSHKRVELRKFEWRHPNHFTKSTAFIQNSVWKESRGKADWVVMVDVDEHLMVPGQSMGEFLERYKATGITVVPALGYQMISENFPETNGLLSESITRGAPHPPMNKMAIFNPNAVEESNVTLGRHQAQPIGRLKFAKRDELLLLHYKCLGFDRVMKRKEAVFAKYSEKKKNSGASVSSGLLKYTFTREESRNAWDNIEKRAIDISRSGFQGWKHHLERLWWWKYNPERHWWSDWSFRIFRNYSRIINKWFN